MENCKQAVDDYPQDFYSNILLHVNQIHATLKFHD